MRSCTIWTGGHSWYVDEVLSGSDGGSYLEKCSRCGDQKFSRIPKSKPDLTPRRYAVELFCGTTLTVVRSTLPSPWENIKCPAHGGEETEIRAVELLDLP